MSSGRQIFGYLNDQEQRHLCDMAKFPEIRGFSRLSLGKLSHCEKLHKIHTVLAKRSLFITKICIQPQNTLDFSVKGGKI